MSYLAEYAFMFVVMGPHKTRYFVRHYGERMLRVEETNSFPKKAVLN
jgi:hypothetical protein